MCCYWHRVSMLTPCVKYYRVQTSCLDAGIACCCCDRGSMADAGAACCYSDRGSRCVVACIQTTLENGTDSRRLFDELNSLAIEKFYNENYNGAKPSIPLCSNCGSALHTPLTPRSRFTTATFDDIVFDFDRRSSAIDLKPIARYWSREDGRIIDDWVDWFTTRGIS